MTYEQQLAVVDLLLRALAEAQKPEPDQSWQDDLALYDEERDLLHGLLAQFAGDPERLWGSSGAFDAFAARHRARYLKWRTCAWAAGNSNRADQWYSCSGAYAERWTDSDVLRLPALWDVTESLLGNERLPLCPKHAEMLAIRVVNYASDRLVAQWEERRRWKLERAKEQAARERKEAARVERERKAEEKARADAALAERVAEEREQRATARERAEASQAEARERRRPLERTGFVYFVRSSVNERIKIGTSSSMANLWGRIAAAETSSGGPVRLLALHQGYLVAERAEHLRWKHLRVARSEWFEPGDDLLAYIESVNELQRSRNSGRSRVEHLVDSFGISPVALS